MPLDAIQQDALRLFTTAEAKFSLLIRNKLIDVTSEERRGILIAWAGNALADAMREAKEAVDRNDSPTCLQAELVIYSLGVFFGRAIYDWYLKESKDESDGQKSNRIP